MCFTLPDSILQIVLLIIGVSFLIVGFRKTNELRTLATTPRATDTNPSMPVDGCDCGSCRPDLYDLLTDEDNEALDEAYLNETGDSYGGENRSNEGGHQESTDAHPVPEHAHHEDVPEASGQHEVISDLLGPH